MRPRPVTDTRGGTFVVSAAEPGENRCRRSRSSPVTRPGVAARRWDPGARGTGPPQRATVSGCLRTASAAVPTIEIGSGSPSRIRRSSRQPVSTSSRTILGGPRPPISAMPIGSTLGRPEYQSMVRRSETASIRRLNVELVNSGRSRAALTSRPSVVTGRPWRSTSPTSPCEANTLTVTGTEWRRSAM